MSDVARVSEPERLRRWRLVLGGGDADGTGGDLAGDDVRIDAAMAAVYDNEQHRSAGRGSGRSGGLGRSAPRWRAGWVTSAPTSRSRWFR